MSNLSVRLNKKNYIFTHSFNEAKNKWNMQRALCLLCIPLYAYFKRALSELEKPDAEDRLVAEETKIKSCPKRYISTVSVSQFVGEQFVKFVNTF